MSVLEAAKQPENKADPGRALRVFVAGVNAWFCAAGYPWFFLDAPDPVVTTLHFAPMLLLATGAIALASARTPPFLRENASTALLASFVVSVAGAVIARERASQTQALTGFALLWCVLSLWVFVGVLTEDTPPKAHSRAVPVRARNGKRPWLVTLVIAGALLMTTLGPSATLPTRGAQPWLDGEVSGALLTAAIAIALSLGALLIVLGPSAIKPRKPTHVPWPRRVLPSLLLAALSCGTYLLFRR